MQFRALELAARGNGDLLAVKQPAAAIPLEQGDLGRRVSDIQNDQGGTKLVHRRGGEDTQPGAARHGPQVQAGIAGAVVDLGDVGKHHLVGRNQDGARHVGGLVGPGAQQAANQVVELDQSPSGNPLGPGAEGLAGRVEQRQLNGGS